MPRNHGRNVQKRSPGKRAGRVPGEAAGRRPRDSGVDVQSASVRLPVASTGSRAQGPECANEASDRSSGNEVLQTVQAQADSPSLADEGSDSGVYDSDSSSFFFATLPRPYDGTPDQRVFDQWVFRVKNWASLNELRSIDVMVNFHLLLTGSARRLYQRKVYPPWVWKPKKVFKLLQKECFPSNHKVLLYDQLKSAKQGNREAAEFAEELTFLASHLPHVSGKFLALVFWSGLNRRIPFMLIRDGIEPEDFDLETLAEHASKYDHVLRYSQCRW